jgi:hypothetical protein
MKSFRARQWLPVFALMTATGLCAAEIRIDDLSRLGLENARAEKATYRGKAALKMTQAESTQDSVAVLKGLEFRDGEIDVEVASTLSKSADPTARGFIGIVFRIQPDSSHAESIYLRPTNGRADDQLRRNHSVQYVSPPEWTWQRLRQETPGQYESYADMQAGEWIEMRVVVHGKEASLYVGGAAQPCLIVKDLKLGESQGGVGLWIGPGTEGYFRNVRVTPSGH